MWCYRGRISLLSLGSKKKSWHKLRKKKQMQKNEERLEKFRGVGTKNNFSCSLLK